MTSFGEFFKLYVKFLEAQFKVKNSVFPKQKRPKSDIFFLQRKNGIWSETGNFDFVFGTFLNSTVKFQETTSFSNQVRIFEKRTCTRKKCDVLAVFNNFPAGWQRNFQSSHLEVCSVKRTICNYFSKMKQLLDCNDIFRVLYPKVSSIMWKSFKDHPRLAIKWQFWTIRLARVR